MKAATAQINTAALRHNLAVVKRHAPACKIIAVVKANAYGHGLLPVARTLVDADAYAVARIEEALMLRSCAVVKPIVLLEGFFSADDLPVLAANNLQTAVHTWEQLEALEQVELPAPWWPGSSLTPACIASGCGPTRCPPLSSASASARTWCSRSTS